uniref:protein O-GlcNAc transferase n=2 Tax=Guillardia theta TaxID=55529 RepID=A0A6U6B809_GUITH|mmetsp:Transcript_36884/g.115459  ORF Transcript_36884/g.115459 Transcript_36884/m.115459 type:complete len:656 (+) Transcript_36884:594-2561(+)
MSIFNLCSIALVCLIASASAGCPDKDQLLRKIVTQARLSTGDFAEAIRSCGADEHLFMELGAFLHKLGVYHLALSSFWTAVRLNPADVGHRNNVAACLLSMSRPREAVLVLEELEKKVKEEAETSWKTDLNMASALFELGEYAKSETRLTRVVASNLSFPHKHVAVANLLFTRRKLCSWGGWDEDLSAARRLMSDQVRGKLDQLPIEPPVDPFMALAFAEARWSKGEEGEVEGLAMDPTAFLLLARHYTELMAPEQHPLQTRMQPAAQIQLGYVSSDLGRRHSMMLLIKGAIERHSPRVRVLCFLLAPPMDPSLVPSSCSLRSDLSSLPDLEASRSINGHGPHVLVDLNGWTAGNRMRIFSYRPAALQVGYMGFTGTTGAGFIDYVLVDSWVAPPEVSQLYSEKFVVLPTSYMTTDYLQEELLGGERARKTRAGRLTFCNHDSLYKLDPTRFTSWMKLLEEVEGSTLLLLAQGNSTESSLLSRAPPHLRSRIVFQPFLDVRKHLERIRACDLALDTHGISGHTTSANYLWGGVPLVSLPSFMWAGRVTSSLLSALSASCHLALLGIARSEDDFVQLSKRLARSAGDGRLERRQLEDLRTCMAGATDVARGRRKDEGGLNRLFDNQRWVEGWEEVLRMMVESRWTSASPVHVLKVS